MKLIWNSKILIGKGGNASVYKIYNDKGSNFAVKISKSIRNDKAYQRFCDEVEILEKLNGNEGIVPILYKHLPEKVSIDRNFYELLISKIILFNSIENIHGTRNNSIGQLLSAVVPYATLFYTLILKATKKMIKHLIFQNYEMKKG